MSLKVTFRFLGYYNKSFCRKRGYSAQMTTMINNASQPSADPQGLLNPLSDTRSTAESWFPLNALFAPDWATFADNYSVQMC